MTLFNEMDHRLSVVKRWGTLPTIQTQSIAEHAFRVQRIAMRLAYEFFGYGDRPEKPDAWEFLALLTIWAHHHDDLESISGDLPTMVKPYFDEEAMAIEHADLIPVRSPDTFEIKAIVKLADKLEGFHFLTMELHMGNRYVAGHHANYYKEIKQHILESWPERYISLTDGILHEMRAWNEVDQSIRHSRRGR